VTQDGRHLTHLFQDIKVIRFLNPGKNYEAEDTFNGDRRDMYVLQYTASIVVKSRSRIVSLRHSKVARIEFGPTWIQQPQPGTEPGVLIESY